MVEGGGEDCGDEGGAVRVEGDVEARVVRVVELLVVVGGRGKGDGEGGRGRRWRGCGGGEGGKGDLALSTDCVIDKAGGPRQRVAPPSLAPSCHPARILRPCFPAIILLFTHPAILSPLYPFIRP